MDLYTTRRGEFSHTRLDFIRPLEDQKQFPVRLTIHLAGGNDSSDPHHAKMRQCQETLNECRQHQRVIKACKGLFAQMNEVAAIEMRHEVGENWEAEMKDSMIKLGQTYRRATAAMDLLSPKDRETYAWLEKLPENTPIFAEEFNIGVAEENARLEELQKTAPAPTAAAPDVEAKKEANAASAAVEENQPGCLTKTQCWDVQIHIEEEEQDKAKIIAETSLVEEEEQEEDREKVAPSKSTPVVDAEQFVVKEEEANAATAAVEESQPGCLVKNQC